MPDPRFVAAQAHDAPFWVVIPSETPVTVGFGNRFEIGLTRAEFFAFLATLPDSTPPPIPEPTPKPPVYSLEWRIVTTDVLNVRNAPNGAIVGSLKQGAVIQVKEGQTAGAYVWRKVVGKDWWLAEQFTAVTEAPSITRWVNTDNLNVRPAPGLAQAAIGSLTRGTAITLQPGETTKDGYSWGQLTSGGWVALKFLSDTAPAPEPPLEPKPPPVVVPVANLRFPRLKAPRTRIGLHIIGWVPQAIDFAARMRQAGRPLAGAMVVNEEKMVGPLRAAMGPDAIIIFRTTQHPDGLNIPPDAAAAYRMGVQFASEVLPDLVRRAPGATAFKLLNEWLSRTDPVMMRAGCAAYRGCMDFANSLNKRIVVGDLNSGHPELDDPAIQEAMHEMLTQAEREGHLLNQHVYVKDGRSGILDDKTDIALRWPNYMAERYPKLQAVTGELGPNNNATHPGREPWLAMARDYNGLVQGNDRVLAAYLYTLTQYDSWPQSNYLGDLQALSEVL